MTSHQQNKNTDDLNIQSNADKKYSRESLCLDKICVDLHCLFSLIELSISTIYTDITGKEKHLNRYLSHEYKIFRITTC